jgi:hypothetical protein
MCAEIIKDKNDELVPLASFQGEYEAKIVQSILKSGGIESILKGDIVHGVHPITVDGLGMVTIYVFRRDLEEARAVLEQEPDYDETGINWIYPESDTQH